MEKRSLLHDFAWGRGALRATLLALVCAPQGEAMILLEKKTAEENRLAKEGANRFASQLGNTVQICLPSGMGIGYDKDGSHGYVLTAAHVLASDSSAAGRKSQGGFIRFRAPGALDNPTQDVRILARKALLHPGYAPGANPAPMERKHAPAEVATANDLALDCFAVTAWTKRDLDRLGFFGAQLYDGPATAGRPLLEAHVAGFGRYGTSESAAVGCFNQLLGGSTYVIHRSWAGYSAFHALSLAPEDMNQVVSLPALNSPENWRRFLPGPRTEVWTVRDSAIPVQCHARREAQAGLGSAGAADGCERERNPLDHPVPGTALGRAGGAAGRGQCCSSGRIRERCPVQPGIPPLLREAAPA
jgi:hypothetical protein